MTLSQPSGGTWYAFNNDFDSTVITNSTLTNGYNAYLNCTNYLIPTNTTDIFRTNSLTYQTSWFGSFYQPPTSPLINAGSTTANLVGLYEFTTQTNQISQSNSIVDIGYHFVATDQYGNPLDTYTAGVPNYLVDSQGNGMDTNGLPYWWEGEYFFQVGLNPTSDPDGDGNNLLYDYENGIDPDVIGFSINVTNNYSATRLVSAQLSVTGVPYYISVVLDDTNYVNDAVWEDFTSTNIIINLGLTQGRHNVWVGLRGHADAPISGVWQRSQINLDLTPPTIVITNPTTSTVSMPVIQIYGYSQEPLASISYGISNAIGEVTNLPSEIIDQFYDTNVYNFTTNYFECLDVPLTNGLNTIIIQAIDLAGNTVSTNFDLVLDYSSKTNPPLVQITWPQNGTQLSGGSFVCRGTISDPTAIVATQIAFTNSNTNLFYGGICTNTYTALVDRVGNFWLENLPLNAGTNLFAITATDVVGNTIVTNIAIVQSALNLAINPVSNSNQLWQATINLTGTISDPTYAIWVNGVKGYNNGNGTWYANNVPVEDGGTADFTATAYSPMEQQPDGSYGN